MALTDRLNLSSNEGVQVLRPLTGNVYLCKLNYTDSDAHFAPERKAESDQFNMA